MFRAALPKETLMNTATDSTFDISAAEELLRSYERLFGNADIAGILAGIHEDVVVRFGDQPEIRGKAATGKFLEARFARMKGYSLKKELRAVYGTVVVGVWDGWWEDATNGKKMQGRGIEVLTHRDGKLWIWEAAFNPWEVGKGPSMPIV